MFNQRHRYPAFDAEYLVDDITTRVAIGGVS